MDDFFSNLNWQIILKPILVILVTAFILIVFSFWYYFKIKKMKKFDTPKGLVFLVQSSFQYFDRKIDVLLGKKFCKLTPYIFLILVYINLNNFVAFIFNVPSPFIFLSVILSLGLITFLGIFYFSFKFSKSDGFKKLFNPWTLLSRLTIFISISFRLFGNLLSGFIIISLVNIFLANSELFGSLIWFNPLSIILAPLHSYFDFFAGPLHIYIFVTLTLIYWSLEKKEN